MNPSRKTQGFTLLEMIIAIAVAAVLAVVLYTSLSVAAKARTVGMGDMEVAHKARLALNALGKVMTVLPPTIPPGTSGTTSTTSGTTSTTAGTTASTSTSNFLQGPFVGTDGTNEQGLDGDSILFNNTSDPLRITQSAGDVEQVTLCLITQQDYDNELATLGTSMGNGMTGNSGQSAVNRANQGRGDKGLLLVRKVSRHLLTAVPEIPRSQILSRDVVSLNFRYYDGATWSDSWDSTQRDNVIPQAVEVTLELSLPDADGYRDLNNPYRVIELFRLPCADPAAANAAAAAAGTSDTTTTGN